MNSFLAILLVCSSATAPAECTESTALSVQSVLVASELGCATGWQDVAARSAQAPDMGHDTFIKTVCRRVRTPAATRD